MKYWLGLATLILATGCTQSGRECDVDPAIFCGPFSELAAEMSEGAKAELLALPRDEYWKLHMGLGMGVRNRFGLWQENELTRFFKQNGVEHPDSMSAPFIHGYVLYLRDKPVDMAELLRSYGPPPPPPPPPPRPAEPGAAADTQAGTRQRPNNSSKPTPLRGAA